MLNLNKKSGFSLATVPMDHLSYKQACFDKFPPHEIEISPPLNFNQSKINA